MSDNKDLVMSSGGTEGPTASPCAARSAAGVLRERKGHIWPEYWIDCGICEYHEGADKTRAEAVASAKQRGWVWTRQYGWICPDCRPQRPAETRRGC